ncbi:SDR family oxidoreductase [Candidatus Gottesmanbacteria bacterium]|nr:SDR family oxidoreductase [Candidatus Gottesmanbacteria bacterium]
MINQKVVLISGSSSGIGFETALRFARSGYITFASMRNLGSEGGKKLLEIKKTEKIPIFLLPLDVTRKESVKKAIENLKKEVSIIDILINNAGFGFLGPIEEFSIEEMKMQFDTNIFGTMRLTKEVVPMMRKQKAGLIINLSSIAGLVPVPLYGMYSSSKFALEALSECLRFELSHFGIKVTLLEPGSFNTNFSQNRYLPKIDKKSSPYQNLSSNFFRGFKAANPRVVAEKIFAISQKPNPKTRYLVGRDAVIYYYLKKLLPEKIWEWGLRRIYNW